MSFMSEFKEFALKGNVMDLAVGVIIGAAFGKIVDSVVNDLGHARHRHESSARWTSPTSSFRCLRYRRAQPQTLDALKKAGVPVFAYGNFITILINFIILAFIIFLMVKQMNRLKKQAPPAPAAPPEDVVLLREIRDALKADETTCANVCAGKT